MLIGNKIFELRKRIKMSQEELADKVDVSRQTVSNWETGQTIPDLYQAKKIADIFKITIDELIDNKSSEEKAPEEPGTDVSNAWNEIKRNILDNISQFSYDVWFEDIKKAKVIADNFYIYPTLDFICRHINDHYQEHLLKLIHDHYSKDIKKVIAILDQQTKEKLTEEFIKKLEQQNQE